MADIERWITVNGVHIPIMKGESKARAVGNFIKRNQRNKQMNRYNERNDKYLTGDRIKYDRDERLRQANDYMEKKYGKNWDKRSNKDIKGYSTDPYNRVNKAQAARLKASREHQWDKDQAYGLLRTIREDGSKTLDSRLNDLYKKEKPNASRLEKSKTRFEAQRLRNEYDAKLFDAEARYKSAQAKQSKAMDDATSRELNRDYKGYKLKVDRNTAQDVSNAVKDWGTGMTHEQMATQVYHSIKESNPRAKVVIVNDKYLEVDGHRFRFVKNRKKGGWEAKEY